MSGIFSIKTLFTENQTMKIERHSDFINEYNPFKMFCL